jgi:DNA-binding response OmpR family regulator
MKRVPRTLKNRASEMIRFSVFRKATSHFDHQFTIQAEKVKRLRRKLEPETHPYRYIHTVWGVGYRLEALPVEETR